MTSARRTQDDLKKILGVDSQGSMFAPWEERAPIPASRGVWQSGDGSTKSGAGPGTNDEGEAVNPVKPDDSALNDNPDGSGGGGGSGTGNNDGSEFIVPDEVPPNFDSNDDLFGGDWGAGGVSTYKDCADDTCIKLNKSGAFVPPEGWDSPDLAPIDPSFGAGIYYAFGSIGITGLTASQCCRNVRDWNGGDFSFHAAVLESGPAAGGTYACVGKLDIDGTLFGYANIGGVSCAESGGPDIYCGPDVEPPRVGDYWPDDGCIQLANIDGQWQSHPKESPNDITTKYSEGKSILDLCTPSGDGVQILPGIDGGVVEWNYTKGIFLATSPDGRRSFGGATEVTAAVAGTIAGGGYIKQVGAPTGS
jgi:hypothetical protein